MSEDYDKPKRNKEWWEYHPYHKLWCNDYCPLIPRFKYRKGDEYNANAWQLHWLIINLWTMENCSFSIDCDIKTDGVAIGMVLPYLRIRIGIMHVYNSFTMKLTELTRRKPAIKSNNS